MSSLVAVCVMLAAVGAAGDEEEEYGPGPAGLIVTWGDGDRSVTLPASRLAFRLSTDESPHPQIAPERFTGRWTGRLHVVRPGRYRFTADVSGEFTLKLAGKEVLVAHDHQPHNKQGSKYVELPFGHTELEATYAKTRPGGATVRLYWQREGEFQETVPAVALRHAPAQETKEFKNWQQIEEGRRLFAEHRCALCHKPDEKAAVGLPIERGPKLDHLKGHVTTAWINHWLGQPHKLRPGTHMPEMFRDNPEGRAARFSVSNYLAGGDAPREEKQESVNPKLIEDGKQAFLTIGCIACHQVPGEKPVEESSTLISLDSVGSKLDREGLIRQLTDPRSVYPDGRMPNFHLEKQPEKLAALVSFLQQQKQHQVVTSNLVKDSSRLPGKFVLETGFCLNCHDLAGAENRSGPSLSLKDLVRRTSLGQDDNWCQYASRSLSKEKRQSLRQFMARGAREATHAAPLMTADVQLDRRGCTACHEVNGRGGTFAKRILDFVPLGTDQTIKDVAPPDLNGIGEKLHLAAIERVVTGDARARPWMELQMPHFAKEQVAGLMESLMKMDGIDPSAPPPKQPKTTPEQVEQGRLLVGRTGFNCVSCHDIRGVRSIGVRGPDLALVTSRVTHDWFRRWMLDPQRITPGTRMPTVFFGGKSAAPQFLAGEPEAQMAALWAYMSKGESLPLPIMPPTQVVAVKGGESPRFVPEGKPMIVHGFMPGVAGLRGIAAGFSAGVHFAFDSEKCQLTQAWTGDFAEVGGWLDTGRGTPEDNAVKVLGKPVWQGPDESWIGLELPNRGTELPDRVQFEACWTEAQEVGFSYRLHFTGDRTLHVEDWVAPVSGLKEAAFVRHLHVREAPPDQRLMLLLSGASQGLESAIIVEPNRSQATIEIGFDRRLSRSPLRLGGNEKAHEATIVYLTRRPRDRDERQVWDDVVRKLSRARFSGGRDAN